MRLFLIWYEILMDNATDDCHKMFQNLVPKIGSQDSSEVDLFTVKTFGECEFCSAVNVVDDYYLMTRV